jgi:predicted nucleic acid-binding protein
VSSEGQRIVSNTGPLISLEKLSQGYDFIRRLYEKIFIPPAVLNEVAEGQFENPQAYLQYYGISDLIEVRTVSQPHPLPEAERLHDGEMQAIRLALELQLPLLIEETVGRRVAQNVGIQISGIAGQIVKALRQQVISATEANSKLDELLRAGRINRKIYEALLVVIPSA